MDEYTREVMDVKSIVTRSLEKKGVLSKIRAELRANVFEAIKDDDKVVDNKEGLPPALLGSCNDRSRRLHASPSGRLLSALVCEYLEWGKLEHSLKVYQPECNLQNDSWKSELGDFISSNGYELSKNGDSGPRLLDVLEGFFKFESKTETINGNSMRESETESSLSLKCRNPPRRSSASDNLQRPGSASQGSDKRDGSGYRKDELKWRNGNKDAHEEVVRASTALDRKSKNLSSSWRNVRDGTNEIEGKD